jgi:phage-related protein
MKRDRKPIEWIGSCLKDLREFPEDVKDAIGVALDVAQQGDKHDAAKPLQGFGGAGVLEVIDDFDGDTYRAVYTVKFKGVVYALHAFQKKSKKGISTPKDEIDLVKKRIKAAEEHYKENYERGRP